MLKPYASPIVMGAEENLVVPAHEQPRISPQDLLRGPTMPRLEMFLMQFSQDHEVTLDEVEAMVVAHEGLDAIMARALRGRAKLIIERFGTPEARSLAKTKGLLS